MAAPNTAASRGRTRAECRSSHGVSPMRQAGSIVPRSCARTTASRRSSVAASDTPGLSRARVGIHVGAGWNGRSRSLSRQWIGQNPSGVTPTIVTIVAAFRRSVECTVTVDPMTPESPRESPDPQAMAHHRDRCRLAVLVSAEAAPNGGTQTERGEIPRRHPRARHVLRMLTPEDREAVEIPGGVASNSESRPVQFTSRSDGAFGNRPCPGASMIDTSRSDSGNGSGRNSTYCRPRTQPCSRRSRARASAPSRCRRPAIAAASAACASRRRAGRSASRSCDDVARSPDRRPCSSASHCRDLRTSALPAYVRRPATSPRARVGGTHVDVHAKLVLHIATHARGTARWEREIATAEPAEVRHAMPLAVKRFFPH